MTCSTPLDDAHENINNIHASYENGYLKCSFEVLSNFTIYETNFDLNTENVYFLLAKGPLNNGIVGFHTSFLPSSDPYFLGDLEYDIYQDCMNTKGGFIYICGPLLLSKKFHYIDIVV